MKLREATISEPVWQGKAHLTINEASEYLAIGRTKFLELARLYHLKRIEHGQVVRYPVGEVQRLKERLTRTES